MAKNYFNEKTFTEKLIKFQKSCEIKDRIVLKCDKILERELIKEIEKIINAVIYNYRFWDFEGEETEDLKQHALENCYKNLIRFIPGKGTAFNFFTKISRMSLLNYTIRREKHRGQADITEEVNIISGPENNFDFFLENVEDNLQKIIDEKLNKEDKEKNEKIMTLIIDYIRKNKKFISKTDLYSHGKVFGVKNSDIRNFINKIQEYNDILFRGIS